MNTRALFVFISLQCIFLSVIAAKTKNFGWLLARDFTSEELVNLNPQQEHELLLRRFTQKGPTFLAVLFTVEVFANGIGNDFFELSDEKASIENKAIVKAAFHCFTQLQFKVRINKLLQGLVRNASNFVNETGSLGAAYNKVCSKIDENLKNETMYTTLRDEYKKVPQASKKTYQYGIPKSEHDLRKSFAELANDPQSKKLNAFYILSFFVRAEEIYNEQALVELASQPGKGEAVQKIYEESTNEIIPLVKDILPEKLDMDFPLNINLSYLRPNLSEKILSKIKENPNLKDEFQKIHDRIRDENNKLDDHYPH